LARRPPDAIPSAIEAGAGYLEVPPDVTTGWVVVVVGGIVVVVVVGGAVVGVVVAGAELNPPGGVVVVVGAIVVVVVVVVGVVAGVPGLAAVGTEVALGAFDPAEDPGCSLATVTPMNAAAPPATRMAVLVRRLMRACARARADGEYWSRLRLTTIRGSAAPAPARVHRSGPRRLPAYGSNLKNR
jgi:hypothetical protein